MGNPFDNQARHDNTLIYNLFSVCSNHNFDDNRLVKELLSQLAPYVRFVVTKRVGSYISDEIPCIEQESLEDVILAARRGVIPVHSEDAFFTYIYSIINGSIIKSIKRLKRQEFTTEYSDSYGSEYDNKRYMTHSDVESSIYVDQLRDLSINLVKLDNRFVGLEKLASIYIAERLLKIRSGDPISCKYRFKLTEDVVNFLIGYTKSLIRMSVSYLQEVESQ